MTGCEVLRDGSKLTFIHENNRTNITIGGLIFSVVFALFILWWFYAVIKRFYIHKKSDLWVCTVATIIDENKDYQNGIASHRTFRGSIEYKDYKIEYFVNGKSYIAYLNGADLIGCDDTVEIEYLKNRPTGIRKKKEK
ncbi:MAG: hypothetical protein ACI4GW_11025 [Lachnospiraceae bacterium]